jgi:hypothetical protein
MTKSRPERGPKISLYRKWPNDLRQNNAVLMPGTRKNCGAVSKRNVFRLGKKLTYPPLHYWRPFSPYMMKLWNNQCFESVTFWYRSVSLTKGSGPGSCSFCQWPSRCLDANKKMKKLLFLVFLLITFWRYTQIILPRKKVIKNSQNSRNQGFLLILLDDGRIQIKNSD